MCMKRVLLGSMPENLAEFEQLKQKFSTLVRLKWLYLTKKTY